MQNKPKSYAEIPGFQEDFTAAQDRQRLLRDSSFFDEVPLEILRGISVLPLTLRKITVLQIAGNPYICGGPVLAEDAVTFLWVVSNEHVSNNPDSKRRFSKKAFSHSFEELDRAICEFLADQWAELEDTSSSSGSGRGVKKSIPVDQACTAASYIHLLASKYGWEEQYILDMPITRILQYRNLIISEIDPQHKPASLAMDVIRKYNRKLTDILKSGK